MATRKKASVPSPAEFLGKKVGEDRILIDWPQIVNYMWALDRTSNRVQLHEVGRTSTGENPFLMGIISSPETLANLDSYREIQRKLADPRLLSSDAEAEELIAQGKAVIMLTCGIHPNEISTTQASLLIAHRLAVGEDEEVHRILDNVIIIFTPCQNPDGLRTVKQWYDSTLGTRYEGVTPPVALVEWRGVDLNRDWFMFTQNETRLMVEHGYNTWHPQVGFDMHDMGPYGVRMSVPPFIDPIDPNVDPILQANLAMMGGTMLSEMMAQGLAGVAINCYYDAWTPGRSYQHYHNAIRILTEVASARTATPIEVKAADLIPQRDIDPTVQTWNNPMPWTGGRWGLPEEARYNLAAALAGLSAMARLRDVWLRNTYKIARRAISGPKKPFAFLVPAEQRDPVTANEMLQILRTGAVEIHVATRQFTADGVTYPSGTRVILTTQPNGAFAKTMLETQHYPDMRYFAGGPPKRPYDTTAHSLPLQMGVSAAEVQHPFQASLKLADDLKLSPGKVTKLGQSSTGGYLLRSETNASARAVNRLLAAGAQVTWSREALTIGDTYFQPGMFLIEGGREATRLVTSLARDNHMRFDALPSLPSVSRYQLRTPRVGLYKSWYPQFGFCPTVEEGFARQVLEEYEFPYKSLVDADIRQGGLQERFDAVVLPHLQWERIDQGLSPSQYPPEYTGGLGDQGAATLRAFVEAGGTLITWDGSAEYAVRRLNLPVANVLAGIPEAEFYGPGSFFRVVLDTSHPIAYGMPQQTAVVFERGPAYELHQGVVVGRYPMTNPLLSGWLLGPEKLYGRAALVEVPVGRGRVILIGFKVHFRAQARGTYRILFNSLFYSAATPV